MKNVDIEISEVAPRDGLQSIPFVMSTDDKKRWISALYAAGIPEIEVGSFVSPKLLPQMADTADITRFAKTIDGLVVAVLVPNARGARSAIEAGADKLTIPVSVSETHSLKNVRRSHPQMLDEIRAIRQQINELPVAIRPKLEGGLSTAFGCTLEGRISHDKVVEMAEQIVEAGCDEVGLSDTTGFGDPRAVRQLTQKVWQAVGKDKLTGIHLHNTRGQGLANVLAAIDVGLTTIDASMGGIGGCPFAPGASGNIVTEDLVFLLEAMGLKTGVQFNKLIEARSVLAESLPDAELFGFVPDAGLPKGFQMVTPQVL